MPMAIPRRATPSPRHAVPEGLPPGAGRDRERVARALACYVRLSRGLHALGWKERLRAQGADLHEARAHEAPVLELLAREEGRSLKALRARRNRVEELARQRLSQLGRHEGLDFVGVLERLEGLLSAPAPRPPDEDEPVLLEGSQGMRQLLSWPGTWAFGLLVLTNRYGVERHGQWLPLLVLGGAVVLFYYLRYTGRFWLTAKRLVWRPSVGEPVEVSLASVPDDGVSALPLWGQVRVEGDRTVTVRHVEHAGRLAALLDLLRCAPFRGAVDGMPRVREVSVLPAWRVPENAPPGTRGEHGVAVLRPGYAAFLPSHRAAGVFRGLVGIEAHPAEGDLPLEVLVEQLRRLSEADFDAYLRQAVFSNGGELWLADEVGPPSAPGAGEVYRLRGRGRGMEMRPDLAQAEAAHRIVRQWAA